MASHDNISYLTLWKMFSLVLIFFSFSEFDFFFRLIWYDSLQMPKSTSSNNLWNWIFRFFKWTRNIMKKKKWDWFELGVKSGGYQNKIHLESFSFLLRNSIYTDNDECTQTVQHKIETNVEIRRNSPNLKIAITIYLNLLRKMEITQYPPINFLIEWNLVSSEFFFSDKLFSATDCL